MTSIDNASGVAAAAAAAATGEPAQEDAESAHEAALKQSLYAVGLVVAAVGILLDCATLHVLRSAKFGGRAAAVRQSLVSLCGADLLLAVATVIVCACAFGESSLLQYEAAATGEELAASKRASRRLYCVAEWAQDFWSAGTHANLLTLLIMAGEQAAAVRWPFDSERLPSSRRVALTFGVAWAISLAVGVAQPAVAMAINAQHPYVDNYTVKGTSRLCYQRILYSATNGVDNYTYAFDQRRLVESQTGLGVALMAVAFVGLMVAYGYMFAVVRGMVLADRALAPSASPRSAAWRGSRRVVAATLSVTAVFLVCYGPLFVYNLVRAFTSTPEGGWLYPALFAITALTTVGDPLVYAWRLKEIRAGFLGLLKRCRRSRSGDRRRRCDAAKRAEVKGPREALAAYPSDSADRLLQPLSPAAAVTHSSSTDAVTTSSYVML